MTRKGTKNKLPAVPPSDYEGTIADWAITLISKGLMKERQFYGDIWLTENQYVEVLEECEKDIKRKE